MIQYKPKYSIETILELLQIICPDWLDGQNFINLVHMFATYHERAKDALKYAPLVQKRFVLTDSDYKRLFKTTGFKGTQKEFEDKIATLIQLSDKTFPRGSWISSIYRSLITLPIFVGHCLIYTGELDSAIVIDPHAIYVLEAKTIFAKLKTYFKYIDETVVALTALYIPKNSLIAQVTWDKAVTMDTKAILEVLQPYIQTLDPKLIVLSTQRTDAAARRLVTTFLKAYYKALEKKAEEEQRKLEQEKSERFAANLYNKIEQFVSASEPDNEIIIDLNRLYIGNAISTDVLYRYCMRLHDPENLNLIANLLSYIIVDLRITKWKPSYKQDMVTYVLNVLSLRRITGYKLALKRDLEQLCIRTWNRLHNDEPDLVRSWDQISASTRTRIKRFTILYILQWLFKHTQW